MRKAQGLSLNYVVIGIIALVVLVVVITVYVNVVRPVRPTSEDIIFGNFKEGCRELGGTAKPESECREDERFLIAGSLIYSGEEYFCCKQ
ncbi:MAG TPA: hypothetical protein ENN46_04050 [Candidatus Woesearchaeota archaeon]|nr:hypothetical protein [Candidatus Woesearchaeota archaeon]